MILINLLMTRTSFIFDFLSSYNLMPRNFPGIFRQKSKLMKVRFRHFADTIFERATLIMIANSSGTTMSWSSGSLLELSLKKEKFFLLLLELVQSLRFYLGPGHLWLLRNSRVNKKANRLLSKGLFSFIVLVTVQKRWFSNSSLLMWNSPSDLFKNFVRLDRLLTGMYSPMLTFFSWSSYTQFSEWIFEHPPG